MPHCTFVREGHTCGAPSFQDPCSTCLAYARTIGEKTGNAMQAPSPISVNARPSITPAETVRTSSNPTAITITAIRRRLHHMQQEITAPVDKIQWFEIQWNLLEADVAFLAKQLGYQWPAPLVRQQIGSEDPTPRPVTPAAPAPEPVAPTAEPTAPAAEPAAPAAKSEPV